MGCWKGRGNACARNGSRACQAQCMCTGGFWGTPTGHAQPTFNATRSEGKGRQARVFANRGPINPSFGPHWSPSLRTPIAAPSIVRFTGQPDSYHTQNTRPCTRTWPCTNTRMQSTHHEPKHLATKWHASDRHSSDAIMACVSVAQHRCHHCCNGPHAGLAAS